MDEHCHRLETRRQCSEGGVGFRSPYSPERPGDSGEEMVVGVEDVILGGRLEPEVVELAQQLGAMVGSVVHDVDEDLPEVQVLVLTLCKRKSEQLIVAQRREAFAHPPLDLVPTC